MSAGVSGTGGAALTLSDNFFGFKSALKKGVVKIRTGGRIINGGVNGRIKYGWP